MKILFLLIFCFSTLFGCSQNDKFENHIAEIRQTVFIYTDNEIAISYMGGKRESDYNLDLKTTNLQDFGVLTVVYLNEEVSELNAKVHFSDGIVEKTLLVNPYDQSLVEDFNKPLFDYQSIRVTLIKDNSERDYVLQRIDKSFNIQSEQMVELSKEHFKNQISQNQNYEVFVRLLFDNKTYDRFFWITEFYGENTGYEKFIKEIEIG